MQSEQGANATSILPNAQNIVVSACSSEVVAMSVLTALSQLQDSKICGKLHIVDHFTMLIDPSAFNLAYGVLSDTPGATPSSWIKSHCHAYIGKSFLSTAKQALTNLIPGNVAGVANFFISTGGSQANAIKEVPLQPYVCASGSAPASQCQ